MWVQDTENTIYTILYTRLRNRLLAKYPTLNVTSQETENVDTQFPTIYIHFLPFAEKGNDLENVTVNAVMATLQYEISTNGANRKAVLNDINGYVIEALKELMFNITSTGEFVSTRIDVESLIGRVHRIIGKADTFDLGT